jgi:hypothetical protein
MYFDDAIHPDEVPDRNRLLFSLVSALLIASFSFALIFLLFGSLPYLTLHWLSTLPPAKASRILSMMDILAWTLVLFSSVFTPAILLAMVARKQRSKHRPPIQSI